MPKIIAILVVTVLLGVLMLMVAGCEEVKADEPDATLNLISDNPPKIEWVGCPVLARPDDYHIDEFTLPTIEVGLRDDGIVVWRETLPQTHED